MKTITKRDVLFFFLGFFTMLIIEIIINWPDSINSFKAGFEAAVKIENTKGNN